VNINQNIRMLIINDANEAVLSQTVGNEVNTLPLANVKLNSHARTFRSLNHEHVQIVMHWQAPVMLSGLVLDHINASDTATWHVELFDDVGMSVKVYDSLVMPIVEQKTLGELEWLVDPLISKVVKTVTPSCEQWFDDVYASAVRITIKDPLNTDGFIDIRRIFAGRALQPRVNFSFGYKVGWIGQSQQRRTAGGGVHTKRNSRPRTLSFSLNYLTEMDRPYFHNAIQRVGDDVAWYVSMFPGVGGEKERHYAMSCFFIGLPDIEATFHNNFKLNFNVGEA